MTAASIFILAYIQIYEYIVKMKQQAGAQPAQAHRNGGPHGGSCCDRSRPQRNADGLRIAAAAEKGRSPDRRIAGRGLSLRPLESVGGDRLAQAKRDRD